MKVYVRRFGTDRYTVMPTVATARLASEAELECAECGRAILGTAGATLTYPGSTPEGGATYVCTVCLDCAPVVTDRIRECVMPIRAAHTSTWVQRALCANLPGKSFDPFAPARR